MTALFLTLEGIDGAGKSSHLDALESLFRGRGRVVTRTREPGGTPLGEAVRGLVLDAIQQGMCAESEALLMFAARAQLVRTVLEPALAAGRWVLCDRYADASYAYQGGGRGAATARIAWRARAFCQSPSLKLKE